MAEHRAARWWSRWWPGRSPAVDVAPTTDSEEYGRWWLQFGEDSPRHLHNALVAYSTWDRTTRVQVLLVDAGGADVSARRQTEESVACQIVPPLAVHEPDSPQAGPRELTCQDWLALVDVGDRLHPLALYWATQVARASPESCLIYADHDEALGGGGARRPVVKPDWDEELALGWPPFLEGLVLVRGDCWRGQPAGPGWARDVAVSLARAHGPTSIAHLARIACHRPARLPVSTTGRGRERAATSAIGPRAPEDPPSVSILIPTRDRLDLLKPCVESVLSRTRYSRFELVVIDNDSTDGATLDYLARLERGDSSAAPAVTVRVLRLPGLFNFSRLNNRAVASCQTDLMVLLNNDIEVVDWHWLGALVEQAARPDVGAVGAKLLYPDNRIQHAGVVWRLAGVAGHAFCGWPNEGPVHEFASLRRQVIAVSGACLAVRRSVYLEVGGLDEEHLAISYNDVDFCLRLHAKGYRNLYEPRAVLIHRESASRGSDRQPDLRGRAVAEMNCILSRWSSVLPADPFYSPLWSLDPPGFQLAWPPRVVARSGLSVGALGRSRPGVAASRGVS